jgi:hypothetical protein
MAKCWQGLRDPNPPSPNESRRTVVYFTDPDFSLEEVCPNPLHCLKAQEYTWLTITKFRRWIS